VYHGATAIWSSRTARSSAPLALIANNTSRYKPGNFGVYYVCLNPSGCSYPVSITWNNGVSRASSAYHLYMQNDGNFVEYTGTSGGTALWATNTVGK
jgi:hypothetical protein